MNRTSVACHLLLFTSLLMPGVSVQAAQAPQPDPANQADESSAVAGSPAQDVVARIAPASGEIEEIEIIGQRPMRFLIQEIENIEEQMFDQFNDLNDVNEFRVVCRSLIITGSKIPGRECVPVYIDRARAQSAQDFLQFGIPQKPDSQIWFETREKQAAFNVKIRELALEHPELANSMLELNAKRQELEELQQRQRERTKGWLGRLFSGDKDE